MIRSSKFIISFDNSHSDKYCDNLVYAKIEKKTKEEAVALYKFLRQYIPHNVGFVSIHEEINDMSIMPVKINE